MKTLLRPCLLGCILPFIILPKINAANRPVAGPSIISRISTVRVYKHVAATNTDLRYLRLQLVKDAVNTDEILIGFDNTASAKYNAGEDAKYLQGFGQVRLFSYSADSIPLAINMLPFPKQRPDSIRLNVSAKTSGVFQLYMKQIANIPDRYNIWLMDKYKNDSLDMRHYSTYSFNLDKKDSATYGGNRFTLVIRQDPAYTYQLLSFTAAKVPGARQVQLKWGTANEDSCTHFTVERSNDNGTSYSSLCELRSTGAGEYSTIDKSPGEQNLYRLRQQDMDGNLTYSQTVTISFNDQNAVASTLSIYPNPVSDMINLSVSSAETSNAAYDIKFVNSTGLIIKEVTSAEPSWKGDISSLRPGVYFAQILNIKTDTLVGRKKFVKY